MKVGEAKNIIKTAMRGARSASNSSADALRKIGETDAIEAFYALERQGAGAFVGADDDVKAFLWELARELETTAGVGYGQYPGLLARVLDAFSTAAGSRDARALELRIAILNKRIAAERGFRPDVGWPAAQESAVESELESLSRFELSAEQRASIDKSTTLVATSRTDVRSTIIFDLPHTLVRRETFLEFEYEGAPVRISIRPTSSAAEVIQIAGDNHVPQAMTVLGGGAWPPGVSNVSIVLHALVDWTATVEKYSGDEISPSRERSPAIPKLAADIVRSAVLALQASAPDELDGYWMPVANDIRAYTLQVGTEAEAQTYHMHSLQPGGARVQILDAPTFEADLGAVERPRPWQAARAYAHGALRSARYFDAVVWANVAIEAYIDEVLTDIAADPEVDASELAMGVSVFAEAEEIVARVHPELSGTIPWPTVEKAPSRYRQISAAARASNMDASTRELQKLYSAVSRQRNDAVHGRSIDSVPALDARAALLAFDEFLEKFRSSVKA